jgi:type IV secretory pathway VirB10-like protein
VIRPDQGRAGSPPERAEDFELRAAPRPVRRLDARILLVLVLSLAIGLAAAVLVALRPPQFGATGEPPGAVPTGHQRAADGLERLPKDYAGLATPPAKSPLEAPRPEAADRLWGDNGGEGAAEREEKERLTRQAAQARESPLFVKISATNGRWSPAAREGEGDAVGQAAGAASLAGRMASLPGRFALQDRYRGFLERRDWPARRDEARLEPPPSPYTLLAGTVIAASLMTGLNSDLPGLVIAQVTENVYDSVSGAHLLVPQGARLIGKYDSDVAYGQRRALVVWTRLILPNGASIDIDNLPATDPAGYAGLEDEVDAHTLELAKGIGLASILGLATQNGFVGTRGESELLKYLRQTAQQSAGTASQHLVERDLDRQPTIRVRPGYPLRILVGRDLVLAPPR